MGSAYYQAMLKQQFWGLSRTDG